jgi:hypothetical protein
VHGHPGGNFRPDILGVHDLLFSSPARLERGSGDAARHRASNFFAAVRPALRAPKGHHIEVAWFDLAFP